jgi:hypothetical protein
MNIKRETQGVLSHETALMVHELSDINPLKIHMTVPRGFRRHGKIPGVLILHYSTVHRSDYEVRGGYQVTRPFRTIADLVRGGTLSNEFIIQAVNEGLQKGVLTRKQYDNLLVTPRVGSSLRRIMGEVA